jgi:hypothetical protein
MAHAGDGSLSADAMAAWPASTGVNKANDGDVAVLGSRRRRSKFLHDGL